MKLTKKNLKNIIKEEIQLVNLLKEGKRQHGFDLTDFKPGGFQKVLKGLKIRPKAKLDRNESGWEWKGMGILIVTGNNPITGEYATSVSGKSPVKRKTVTGKQLRIPGMRSGGSSLRKVNGNWIR